MKYCDEYAALISAGVDNALTADERKQLMDHLAQCPACREAYTQMMTMHEAFTDWEEDLPGCRIYRRRWRSLLRNPLHCHHPSPDPGPQTW